MPRRIVRICAIAGITFWAGAACAQATNAPPPKDAIVARKTVMGAIDLNMDEVEGMLAPDGKLETADAREHLDIISVLLQAFPHLFPPATNQWKEGAERDAALDTFAAPALWTSFDDFYARAGNAAKIAFAASRATTLDGFKSHVAELRSACNACHAAYLKTE